MTKQCGNCKHWTDQSQAAGERFGNCGWKPKVKPFWLIVAGMSSPIPESAGHNCEAFEERVECNS